MSNDVLHFPTGMRYRQVGKTNILARDDQMADCLAGAVETFDQTLQLWDAKSCSEVADDLHETTAQDFTVTEINWLKRIESILRNGLPTSDKGAAKTIGHAHSEIELLLESIDPDWCIR